MLAPVQGRSQQLAASVFLVVAAYWFVSFLGAPDDAGTSDGWQLVLALSFFTLACSLVAQRGRRR